MCHIWALIFSLIAEAKGFHLLCFLICISLILYKDIENNLKTQIYVNEF